MVVIAVLLFWPDDEEPSVDEQKSANATVVRPQHGGRALARQPYNHTGSPGVASEMPWSDGYTPQQGYPLAPAHPYSQGQAAPYNGFSFRSPEALHSAPTTRQAPRFPGAIPSQHPYMAPPSGGYGYVTTPSYRFRPQEDAQQSSRRYSGGYPTQDYLTPRALPPQGTYQPEYGTAPLQSWQAPGFGAGSVYPGATTWDQYSGQ